MRQKPRDVVHCAPPAAAASTASRSFCSVPLTPFDSDLGAMSLPSPRAKTPKTKFKRVRFAQESGFLGQVKAFVGWWLLPLLICCAVLAHLSGSQSTSKAIRSEGEEFPSPASISGDDDTGDVDSDDDVAAIDDNDEDYDRLFATKTRYWEKSEDDDQDRNFSVVFVELPDSQQQQQHQQQQQQQQQRKKKRRSKARKLKLVQVQQVIRHGSRFPTKGNIKDIEAILAKLQSKYPSFIPEWMRSYRLPYNMSVEGELAPSGAMELAQFGQRTRQVMQELLPLQFSQERFILSHTYKSRTRDSAKAFASRFFDDPDQVKYIENPKKNDTLLRFYDQCPRYQRDVEENPQANIEYQKYQNSSQTQRNLRRLQRLLQIPADSNLTVVDLTSIYSACAFDLALYHQPGQWCSLLTKSMLRSMDFGDDLEAFHQSGNGFKVNYEIAAVLLRDIFDFMDGLVAGKHQIVGNFRFAHAETTLPLLALMNVTQDEPKLTADWTSSQIKTRRFRTANLSPFAGNIEFRLYQEQQPLQGQSTSRYFVQIAVNEKPIAIAGCNHPRFCELDQLRTKWRFYLEQFNLEQYCAV